MYRIRLKDVLLSGLLLFAVSANAADKYWSGAGTWTTGGAGQWSTNSGSGYGTATWSDGDSAIFEGTPGAVTVSGSVSVSNLVFTTLTTGYALSGGALNFVSGSVISNADNRFWVPIANPITGSPTVHVKDYGSGASYLGLKFAPSSGSQVLGAAMNPIHTATHNADKSGISLDGSTTGNTIQSIVYGGGDRYGTVYKDGAGTWTVPGNITSGTYRHNLGALICNGIMKMDYGGFVLTAGTLAGNCTLTRNDRRGNISFPSAFVIAPGDGVVGTMTIAWGASGTPTAGQQWLQLLDDSIYEWEVGASSNDVIHIVDGKLDLDNFVLKILNAGGAPSVSDQLPVFTYEAGVTVEMTGFSNTVANFDTTEVPAWAGGELSLTNGGAGVIYLTGLNAPAKGLVLIIK